VNDDTITFDGIHIENVESFTYLGSVIPNITTTTRYTLHAEPTAPKKFFK